MPKISLLPTIGFAVAALATASAAQAVPDLARFTPATAQSPTAKLVLCDAIAFFATNPDVEADAIYAPRSGGIPQRLMSSYFLTSGFFYREGYSDLFQKLSARGMTNRAQVAHAQQDLIPPLIWEYHKQRLLPPVFVREQLNYCDGYARSFGVNPNW